MPLCWSCQYFCSTNACGSGFQVGAGGAGGEKLAPRDASGAALVEDWTEWDERCLQPALRQGNAAAIQACLQELAAGITSTGFLHGSSPTLADICIYSTLLPATTAQQVNAFHSFFWLAGWLATLAVELGEFQRLLVYLVQHMTQSLALTTHSGPHVMKPTQHAPWWRIMDHNQALARNFFRLSEGMVKT